MMTSLPRTSAVLGALVAAIALLAGARPAAAQIDSTFPARDSVLQLIANGVDMAVPDYPAFAILDSKPTNILRPSKLRAVGLTLAGVGLQGVIPSTFAMELAPYTLAAGNQSLSSYRSNYLLNSLRISLGSGADSSGGRAVAIGLRITPIDQTDLRTNQAFLNTLFDVGAKITQIESDCFGTVLAAQNMTRVQYLSLAPAQKATVDSLVRACTAQSQIASLDSQIVAARTQFEESMWNGQMLDFGLAARGSSPDSLAKNAFMSGYGFWATYAQPIFGENGQYLIGLNASSDRASALDTFRAVSVSLGARLYIGGNALKAFLEFTGDGAIALKGEVGGGITGSLQAGAEMNIMDGLWLDGSVGYRHIPGSPAVFTHSVNLRLAALP